MDTGCSGVITCLPIDRHLHCERCGDHFPLRCGCRKNPCPKCGLPVFWAGEIPEHHKCIGDAENAVIELTGYLDRVIAAAYQRGLVDGRNGK
jgi:hypothetical protein